MNTTFAQRKARYRREMEALILRRCAKCEIKFRINKAFLSCSGSDLCDDCHRGQTEESRALALTGPQVVALMRRNHCTIRRLSALMQTTMVRIRFLRAQGCDFLTGLDIEQAIAGELTPRLRAMLRQWRRLEDQ